MTRNFLFIALLAMAWPSVVFAYAYTYHDIVPGQPGQHQFPPSPQDTGIPPVTWPASGTDVHFVLRSLGTPYAASASAAMDEWTSVGTRLRFLQDTSNDRQPCAADHVNVIAWRATTCKGEAWGDVLAMTVIHFTSRSGGRWEITDADVMLDSNRSWHPGFNGPLLGALDFQRVVLHELGHAIGLEHPDEVGQQVDAIMNSHVGDLDTLQFDDREGIVFLYGGSTGGGDAISDASTGGSGADLLLPLFAGVGAASVLIRRRRAQAA